jgi:hypothetical protein
VNERGQKIIWGRDKKLILVCNHFKRKKEKRRRKVERVSVCQSTFVIYTFAMNNTLTE